MKLDDVIKRADELIKLGDETLATETLINGLNFVDSGKHAEFRSAALSFLKRVFEVDSPHYTEFNSRVKDTRPSEVDVGIGILKACRAELAGGWLFTTKGLVSAEVFSDFLEMAAHLLAGDYKDAAAVMVGSVLEEHLRQLCGKNSIPVAVSKPDGSFAPVKAATMNAELAGVKAYSKLDFSNVTAWLGLRNKAAHGEYSEYTEEQVKNMLHAVSDFIARTPL